MRYGSIGWSVGATLGYAAACAPAVFDIKACDISQMSRLEMLEQEGYIRREVGPDEKAPASGGVTNGPGALLKKDLSWIPHNQ